MKIIRINYVMVVKLLYFVALLVMMLVLLVGNGGAQALLFICVLTELERLLILHR